MKTLERKDFVFIYLDKDGNELDRKVKRGFTDYDSYKYTMDLRAASLINDLDTIEIAIKKFNDLRYLWHELKSRKS